MSCPYCQFPSCYDSGFNIECANPKCKHYTLKQCIVYVGEHLRRSLLKMAASDFKESPEPFPDVFTCSVVAPATLAVSWTRPVDPTRVFTLYYPIT